MFEAKTKVYFQATSRFMNLVPSNLDLASRLFNFVCAVFVFVLDVDR
jgi:hypothetical protein